MRVLVAGVGNVLRADDGFGPAVADRLAERDLPEGVSVVETGIGGMALVQELQAGYDALVVVDCVDLGRPPGQVMLIEPDVIDVDALSWSERHDLLADMHLATPERAMMLARALGVLPANVLMVGCQPVDPDAIGQGLSEPVEAAVGIAVDEIVRHVGGLVGTGDGDAPTSAPADAGGRVPVDAGGLPVVSMPGPAGVIAASMPPVPASPAMPPVPASPAVPPVPASPAGRED
ncbi:MAG: hydrogenase maturation protease [Acidimicrobiales bacterium]